MTTDSALFELMTWLSPSFPVGGYAYSHGIEYAVEDGRVTDEDSLTQWIDAIVTFGPGRVDGALFVAAWTALREGDDTSLYNVIELADAMRGTSELALEATAQGQAFIDTVMQTWPGAGLKNLTKKLNNTDRVLTYPVAVALVTSAAEIDLRPALLAYLHGFSANLISAGVRLVPLGQIAGQRVTERLKPIVLSALEDALTSDINDIGTATPMIDWASIKHETQYTRLFRS